MKKKKILEIGTGSGYQTAVLVVAMNAFVYTIERQKELHDFAQKNYENYIFVRNFKVLRWFCRFAYFCAFDKILVTCGAEILPTELLKQLKIGGKMVIPMGKQTNKFSKFTKISEKEFEKEEFGAYKFVPMLNNKINNEPKQIQNYNQQFSSDDRKL